MPSRGHWLEAAILSSLAAYQQQGIACVQKIATPATMTRQGKFFRERSTVDFVGSFAGIPVAFDAKATKKNRLEAYNVHDHQLDFLRAFHKAGGLAALLVAFEAQGEGSFLCSISWWDQVRSEIAHRASVPYTRFHMATYRPDEQCRAIKHGAHGLAIPIGDAITPLFEMVCK